MAADVTPRQDTVAWAYEQAPDEAFLGISMASIFAAIGLYLTDNRDKALMVGVLGPAFALTGLMLKLLGTSRHLASSK